MGWLDRLLTSGMRKAVESSEIDKGLFEYVNNAPVYLDQNSTAYVHDGYESNPDLFSVINKKNSLKASIPWELVEVSEDGTEVEVSKDHPILKLWRSPNPTQGNNEFLRELFMFHDLIGNAYIKGDGPTSGKNAFIWHSLNLMPAQYTKIISGGRGNPIKEYQLDIGKTITFPVDEVMHLREPNPEYQNGQSLYGMSKLKPLVRPITASNSAYDANVSSLQNGGLKGFISVASKDGDPGIGKEQAVAFKNAMRTAGRKYDFHITNSDAKWNAMGLSPIDLAILSSLKYSLSTYCNVFGISDLLFNNSEGKTFSNYDAALKAAYTEVVMPELKNLQDTLHEFFVRPYEIRDGKQYIFRPDYSDVEVLQENMAEKADWLLKAYWLTVNEKREQMNYPKLDNPEYDELLIPGNLISNSEEDFTPEMEVLAQQEYDNIRQLNA